ncbi:hypothetical protein D042_3250 [Vibrio parahaemolyticus NIHCB0757]|nr:hypothetical protein D042_3250 [Vibrio parahaemolyticus NIHCB0757]
MLWKKKKPVYEALRKSDPRYLSSRILAVQRYQHIAEDCASMTFLKAWAILWITSK